jgi:hypothetical protein
VAVVGSVGYRNPIFMAILIAGRSRYILLLIFVITLLVALRKPISRIHQQ